MSAQSPTHPAPTLNDVAREAGVSLATASRVLNGSTRRVAENYRDRVVEVAARLGYTPNLPAQATARGTSAMVALLVADIADPYFGEIASGVARGADEAGLIVTISVTNRDSSRELSLVRALRGQRPRGVILAASRVAGVSAGELDVELAAIRATGGSTVVLGPGAGPGSRSVVIDNRGGAEALARELARLGYREAYILAATPGTHTSDDRVAGFTTSFGEYGGAVRGVFPGQFNRDAGYSLTAELIAGRLPRGAVLFGISDVVAIGAISAIRDAGLQPGADIAVAGFDDIPTGRDVTPALTTVQVDLAAIGYRALRQVLADETDGNAVPLPARVILRASTPPRGAL